MVIKREHLDTGETITGSNMKHFIRSYNAHSKANDSDHIIKSDERFSDYLRRHETSTQDDKNAEEKANVSEQNTAIELPDNSWTHKEIDSFMDEEYPDVDYKANAKKAIKLESIREVLE